MAVLKVARQLQLVRELDAVQVGRSHSSNTLLYTPRLRTFKTSEFAIVIKKRKCYRNPEP